MIFHCSNIGEKYTRVLIATTHCYYLKGGLLFFDCLVYYGLYLGESAEDDSVQFALRDFLFTRRKLLDEQESLGYNLYNIKLTYLLFLALFSIVL